MGQKKPEKSKIPLNPNGSRLIIQALQLSRCLAMYSPFAKQATLKLVR